MVDFPTWLRTFLTLPRLARREEQGVLIAAAVAAVLGLLLLAAVRTLNTKWLTSIGLGFVLLWAAFVSGRYDRILLGLVFFAIPLNADFHFDMGYAMGTLKVPLGAPRLGVSVIDLLILFLYVSWIVRLLAGRQLHTLIWPTGGTLLLAFILWSAFSIYVAQSKVLSVFLLVGLVKVFLWFYYLANHVRTDEDLYFTVRCLLAGLVVECLLAWAQQVAGGNLGVPALGERAMEKEVEMAGETVFRVGGTLGHPNALGGYLAAVLPVALAAGFAPLARKTHVGMAGAFALGVSALVLTYSRSAWLATAVACAVLIARQLKDPARTQRRFPAFAAILGALLLLGSFAPLIRARWTEDDRGSALSRVVQTRMATSMIRANPFLGAGLNNYATVMHMHETYTYDRRPTLKSHTVHNIFLLVAAETGVVGLLWLAAYIGCVLRKGWERARRSPEALPRLLAAGMVLGLAARLAHDAMHTGHLTSNPFLWIYPALLVAPRGNQRNGARGRE